MNTAFYTERLRDYLHPYFEHKHYALGRGGTEFRRKTSFGHSVIIVNLIDGDDATVVDFHIGLRHDLVEKAMSGLFGQRDYYLTDSATLLTDWRLLKSADPEERTKRFKIREIRDVDAIGNAFIDFMDRIGFSFLEKYTKLQALDHLYNHRTAVSAERCNHSYQRCFRAMVIAEIRGRRDLALLREKHRAYLLGRGFAGQVVQKFDTNFARAGQISLN
ncbi:MAG: hypothetical protein ABR572_03560 [Cryomorphaceae bacterium]